MAKVRKYSWLIDFIEFCKEFDDSKYPHQVDVVSNKHRLSEIEANYIMGIQRNIGSLNSFNVQNSVFTQDELFEGLQDNLLNFLVIERALGKQIILYF